jgi:hypothetical protein
MMPGLSCIAPASQSYALVPPTQTQVALVGVACLVCTRDYTRMQHVLQASRLTLKVAFSKPPTHLQRWLCSLR